MLSIHIIFSSKLAAFENWANEMELEPKLECQAIWIMHILCSFLEMYWETKMKMKIKMRVKISYHNKTLLVDTSLEFGLHSHHL